MKITESQDKKMTEEKYNLVGNCVHGLDDPYFRDRVCYDATEMAGIVDEFSNVFLSSDEFIQNVNWPDDLMGLPADNMYEFAYNPYNDIYWAYNIEDDIHYFFVKDSINENYRDIITVKSIKLFNILEEMLSEPKHKGEYVYIGTCMNSFDEYGECMHGAFYDEEHFFNSWQTADEISKEEFWSNIDPLSEMYDELKELESDPEYPAEYRYNPNDDVYFIFVGDDTHYFFVNPNSYENIKDAEEDSYDMNLQENIQRIKQMMSIREQQEMTLQEYMDQLLENPVEFLNKLNTDEQFKNGYLKSFGSSAPGNPNFDFLQAAKIKHVLNNGVKITGQIKDRETNEVIKNYEVSTYEEYMEIDRFIADSKAKGRPLMKVGYSGRLDAVKNGKEVAQALNLPLGENWFK